MEMSDRKRKIRKLLLDKLIKLIQDGKFDSTQTSPNDIYSNKNERRQSKEYVNPFDRDNYNQPGVMNIPEMMVAPNKY